MRCFVAAIHGILTNQTDPSWPDKFDAWMYRRDPEVKVLKKEYRAGPFPRWNCWVKDPLLARSLANELELFLTEDPSLRPPSSGASNLTFPPLWLVAHSNGAVIALLMTQRLIARGYQVGGLILTGAACEAEVEKNGVLEWCSNGKLGTAIAYCSEDDAVVAGDARAPQHWFWQARDWLWGKAMWPYGCLGRTGWLGRGGDSLSSRVRAGNSHGDKLSPPRSTRCLRIFNRWYPGGHSTYFKPENIDYIFEQIYRDISTYTPH